MAGEGETEISKSRQKESTHNIEEMLIYQLLYSEQPFILNKNKSSTAGCFRLNKICINVAKFCS